MDLSKIKPKFMNLIDKLRLARKIYLKSAKRIHNEIMADPFKVIALKKWVFIKEVANLYDFDDEGHDLKLNNKLKIEWEKIGIELNDIVLRNNEKVLLEYCIHNEKEILNIYKDILEYGTYNDLFNTVIRNQMNESVQILDELQHLLEPYNDDNKSK